MSCRSGLRETFRCPASVGARDVNLVVAVAVSHEGDLLAVGRPASVMAAFRQLGLPAPVGVHDVELVDFARHHGYRLDELIEIIEDVG